LETPDIVRFLQDTLGSKLTAYIAKVSDAKMVGRWASGDSKPAAEREKRLRNAYQVFQELLKEEDEYVARAWFIGMNPQLNDDAPSDWLREDRAKDVMAAARAFVSGA
jgi:hypothetical protein